MVDRCLVVVARWLMCRRLLAVVAVGRLLTCARRALLVLLLGLVIRWVALSMRLRALVVRRVRRC